MSSLRLNPYFVCFFYLQYYDFLVIQPHIIETVMLSGSVETLTKQECW